MRRMSKTLWNTNIGKDERTRFVLLAIYSDERTPHLLTDRTGGVIAFSNWHYAKEWWQENIHTKKARAVVVDTFETLCSKP